MESTPIARWQMHLTGAIQGVGFRPTVYGLAQELGLTGWVCNTTAGVELVVEGPPPILQVFCDRLPQVLPPIAQIATWEITEQPPRGEVGFSIVPSVAQAATGTILPDLAPCAACGAELFDPNDRRYRYPFINCTHCGPRYTIIERLPYDRPHTTMGRFSQCEDCLREYGDPGDRRFHAQPNACPRCGPQVQLWDRTSLRAIREEALQQTVLALEEGNIVAIQGLGGFQLWVRAGDAEAIQRLRRSKQRPHKPLALMVADLEQARDLCEVSPEEAAWLTSPQAPIVILDRRHCDPGDLWAPSQTTLGLMLPSTPLHHLLLRDLGEPVIATSGNLRDEPLCIDPTEARDRLGAIADLWLVHDRPILRPVDDSVGRIVAGQRLLYRRARGYAPLPLPAPPHLAPLGALGGQQKNTLAMGRSGRVVVSPHLGEMGNPQSWQNFLDHWRSYQDLYHLRPETIACDAHPDYRTAIHGQSVGAIAIPHHRAHAWALWGELRGWAWEEGCLAIVWDGTGYGEDGQIWGGEAFLLTPLPWEMDHYAQWPRFPLVGGDRASREPRRSLLGLLWVLLGEKLWTEPAIAPLFAPQEQGLLTQTIALAPTTSSIGRLFDGVAALLGLWPVTTFEGQAAIALEQIATEAGTPPPAPIAPWWDWRSLVAYLLEAQKQRKDRRILAHQFHQFLAGAIVHLAQGQPHRRVLLTGGCFQNRLLAELTLQQLAQAGYQGHLPQQLPPNDGAIAYGQTIAAHLRPNDVSSG